jgi:multicomponent Na+:H+ antiporter subunit B
MFSLILAAAARGLLPLLLLFSVFLLLRGHNEPGGGFVGGLAAASAFALHALAHGVPDARRVLRVDPQRLAGLGLLVAVVAALVGLFTGRPLFTAAWLETPLPVLGKVGTPILFDTGVYLVVVGIVLTILFPLLED